MTGAGGANVSNLVVISPWFPGNDEVGPRGSPKRLTSTPKKIVRGEPNRHAEGPTVAQKVSIGRDFTSCVLLRSRSDPTASSSRCRTPSSSSAWREATTGPKKRSTGVTFAPVWSTRAATDGNAADAEDVVQDTFAEALRDLSLLRKPEALRPWLLQIVVHQAHRRFRRRGILRRLGLERGTPDATLAALAHPGASSDVRAELALVDRALGRISTEERFAWILRTSRVTASRRSPQRATARSRRPNAASRKRAPASSSTSGQKLRSTRRPLAAELGAPSDKSPVRRARRVARNGTAPLNTSTTASKSPTCSSAGDRSTTDWPTLAPSGPEPPVLALAAALALVAWFGLKRPLSEPSRSSVARCPPCSRLKPLPASRVRRRLQARAVQDTRLEILRNDGRSFVSVLRRGSGTFDVEPGGPRHWIIEAGPRERRSRGDAVHRNAQRGPGARERRPRHRRRVAPSPCPAPCAGCTPVRASRCAARRRREVGAGARATPGSTFQHRAPAATASARATRPEQSRRGSARGRDRRAPRRGRRRPPARRSRRSDPTLGRGARARNSPTIRVEAWPR